MALPKISHTLYKTTLPSNPKTEIIFRGFLSREERILLAALQSQSPEQMALALEQILSNCIVSKLNIQKLISCDLEWLYLNIIMKSFGEELNLSILCSECKEDVAYTMQLNLIEQPTIPKKANIIEIEPDMWVTLLYPTLATLDALDAINNPSSPPEDVLKALATNIECVTHNDETFSLADQTLEEVAEWIDSLSGKQMGMITSFFANIPTISEQIIFDCPKCNHHNVYSVRGLSEIFQ